ncbi:uncharacterized protein AB675_8483 [Cyphellophora attinorum]|uniref:Uncharacterized protein n=1 Tax=Cyphellophora attinorum TaxID=1664694 RepID=A0A0N1HA52_9EURO|nr:uncharacterized protein AB675_8483 [Phialophora attinorum]KPI44750.1 hypothetical protein AB675_8483 [Phialophora attinorum]
MAAVAPPSIVINDPSTVANGIMKPKATPSTALDTSSATPTTTQATQNPSQQHTPTIRGLLKRSNSLTSTNPTNAACYLCDEQNPGDFSPTTKHLDTCLLCSRYFCLIHHSPSHPTVAICNINHSTYYHEMLIKAKGMLEERQNGSNGQQSGAKRDLAELLIQEGIYPSLGEREKAIFATSPVDEQKQKELNSWRSLDAAVANGGVRGEKGEVVERDVVGSDIAV